MHCQAWWRPRCERQRCWSASNGSPPSGRAPRITVSSRSPPMDTRPSTHRLRIERVRDALKHHGLAAVLVPSSDPHLSEYLPERWKGEQQVWGVTGALGKADG